MPHDETAALLNIHSNNRNGLTTVFAIVCILDVFGVYPVVTLPKAIIDCASQNLQLLGERLSENTVSISYCYWIIVIGTVLCPVLWLGSPKDMKFLCSVSVCMVALVFLLSCGCLLFNGNSDLPLVKPAQDIATWRKILEAYGITTFLFDIHPTILTIQVDMRNKYRLTRALLGGFGISLLMFGITTIIVALKFGTATNSSILDALPTSIPLHFAAALVALQLCLTSAVGNNALYQQMEDCMQISRDFNSKRCILRTTLTILAIVIAESVPRFDLVMSLIGGTLTGPLVFVLPPLIYMKMLSMQTKYEEDLALGSFANVLYSKADAESSTSYTLLPLVISDSYKSKLGRYFEILFCCSVIISSIIFTLLTTYFNSIDVVMSYSNVSKPCIYNVSSFLLYL
nr:unnamed protein product [Callosobruchus chinensis]